MPKAIRYAPRSSAKSVVEVRPPVVEERGVLTERTAFDAEFIGLPRTVGVWHGGQYVRGIVREVQVVCDGGVVFVIRPRE